MCEIEEYVTWRSRGAGRVQTAQMNVTVQVPTTVAIAETTEKTVGTTEGKKSLTSKEISTEISSAPTANVDDENKSDTPEAVPQVDENQNAKAGSSSSVVIGVFIVIIVIVVAVSGAFYYR